ncbi:type II toxin-antitoxin system VapC family toxin [Candidatus Micrarchaeota archaeon]|nr:type II toxin-antitoxin system VapC family toxin [Candidatus Micrarchaeota archaeon]
MAIFLDTAVLVAFHNARDAGHETAKQILWRVFHGEFGSVYTSEYIVDEGVTLTFARTKNRHQSNSFLQYCLGSAVDRLFSILPVTSESFRDSAAEYLRQTELIADCKNNRTLAAS